MEFLQHINSSNKFALDVELRIGRPVRVLFQGFSKLVVLKNVEVGVGEAIVLLQQVDCFSAEPALRVLRTAFHE